MKWNDDGMALCDWCGNPVPGWPKKDDIVSRLTALMCDDCELAGFNSDKEAKEKIFEHMLDIRKQGPR